jgi:hypothetical protein
MTSYTLSPVWGAGAQLFDNSGNVLTGGKIYTYAAGTTTNAATYTNPTGSTFNSNPIIADASGRLSNEIWLLVSGAYKFVLKDTNDVLIATYDNIPTLPQPPITNDASSISYEQGYTVTAGAFTVGATYRITNVGTTNFIAIGAAANTVGILFTATGVGSGDGTAEYSRTVETKLSETVSVKDFGAVGDGIVDDTVALQAAFDYCSSTHNTLFFPPGTYTTNVQLNITSGFQIIGSDQGSNQAAATQPIYSCSILWTGSAISSEYIVAVKSQTIGQWVMGFGLTGIALRGANIAYGCLHLTNIRYCNLGTFWVDRGREFNVLIDDNNGSIICGQSQINVIYSRHTTGRGVVLRSNGGSGLTQININQIGGGDFEVGDVDSSVFGHIQVANLTFKGTGSEGNPRASRKNRVLWFAGGDAFAEAGSKNIIDWVNSEGTSVTIDSSASLAYSVLDRRNGMRYNTLNYLINDKYDLELNLGSAHTGTPVFGTVGTQKYNALLFDDSTEELWQWTFRSPKQWRECKITSVDLLFFTPTSGNVYVTYEDSYRPLGTGLGTVPTGQSAIIPCTGGVTNFYTITLTTPLEVTGIDPTTGDSPELFLIRVGRDGTNAADTVVGDLAIFGVRLHCWGNAGAEGTIYRYQPSPDVASLT